MRCGKQEDEWCDSCLFRVPRRTPVLRSSSLRRVLLRANARFVRKSRTVLPSVSNCEQILGLCVVTSLCDTPDDSSSMLKKIALALISQFISSRMVAETVALI